MHRDASREKAGPGKMDGMKFHTSPCEMLKGTSIDDRTFRSRNVENGLELLDYSPLLVRHLSAVELLEGVDTGTRDVRV